MNNLPIDAIVACDSEVERLRARVAELEKAVPRQHVRLPDGRTVKVLGTLPMTVDGCVLGDWASPFVLGVHNEIVQGTTRTTTYAWMTVASSKKANQAHDATLCYSTRALAESARAANGGEA